MKNIDLVIEPCCDKMLEIRNFLPMADWTSFVSKIKGNLVLHHKFKNNGFPEFQKK
jgi:hypothetical protein